MSSLAPKLKGFSEQWPMTSCREQMSTYSKGNVERLERTEEALCLLRRLEALHVPFSHAGWLIIEPLRMILDTIKPKRAASWMFPNRNGGALDLDNLSERVIKPLFHAHGLE